MTTNAEPLAARPFLDFYTTHNIIPVRQDISDLRAHVFRRNYLYRTLGLTPSLFKGADVIEFGPGTGDNAVATSMYGLNKYVLVDGNPPSIRELNKKHEQGLIKGNTTRIVESDILKYRDDEKYDIVICEGLIPGQDRPKEFLDHIASFCALGGATVFTTISYTSQLAEICRRVFRPAIVTEQNTFDRQVQIASSIFKDHLATFGVSTRPIEDWVQDNILHDWLVSDSQVFSLMDALEVFEGRYQFHSTSPRFLVDDRWYKSVSAGSDDFNALARQQYHTFSAMLLDYRVRLQAINGAKIDKAWVIAIEDLSKQAYGAHLKICRARNYDALDEFNASLDGIARILPPEMDATKASIQDFIKGIRQIAAGKLDHQFGEFRSWWGRGQQYASFVREV
jgi:2-polyprenyl-3-methyl-5-hydroxy-6-metoxy-1,4-benzoquinol methylase